MVSSSQTKPLGWQAEPFTLPNATGETFSLNQLMGENGLLVAFICNHCPYVIAVGNRLAHDANVLKSKGINTVAINSNDFINYPADSPDKMDAFASSFGFDFPYLVDEDQSAARAYGAVCTPDFFGFDKTGKLQYRGRLDDARMDNDSNRTPELVNAMVQVAKTGTAPIEQMNSMGCSIKWR
jgi:peroxiredoxin